MARSGRNRWMACAALVMVASMAHAEEPASKKSEARPARSAAGNIGTFDRSRVYAAYWRTVQYNESVDEFNTDLRELDSGPETDALTLRRAKLGIARRNLQASFERDLVKACELAMKNHHVLVTIRGEVILKADGVETIDLTEALIELLDDKPKPKKSPD